MKLFLLTPSRSADFIGTPTSFCASYRCFLSSWRVICTALPSVFKVHGSCYLRAGQSLAFWILLCLLLSPLRSSLVSFMVTFSTSVLHG